MSPKTYQIHSPSHQMVFHTRTIRRTTTANKNDTVLLDIVAYTKRISKYVPTNYHNSTQQLPASERR